MNYNKKPRYRKDDRAMRPVCKRKISRRLRKNLHITILSLFGGEIIFEVFQPTVITVPEHYGRTDGQTDDMQSHNRALRSIAR